MDFLVNHADCHQQVTVLNDGLSIRYAKLQVEYEALHKEMVDYKTRANYWEAQFNKFKSREDGLKSEIEELKAKLRKREQQLFGKKSEQGISRQGHTINLQTKSANKKKKGQQRGSKGHGKRSYDHLPVFGSEHEGGTLNVDRYSAYKVIAKSGLFILAFCWAHVRGDQQKNYW